MSAQDDLDAAVAKLKTDANSSAALAAAKATADANLATATQAAADAAAALDQGKATLQDDAQQVKNAADAVVAAVSGN